MKWTAERRELARELASKHGQRKAAGMLGCSRATLRRALGLRGQDAAKKPREQAPPPQPADPVAQRDERDRATRDRRQIDALVEQLREARSRQSVLDELARHKAPPSIMPRERNSGIREMTAVVLASDWHVEEVVEPEAVAFRNSYDLAIADHRIKRFFDGIIWNVEHHRASGRVAIRDVVLWLGGDLLSGYIHEELLEGNQLSPTQTVLWLLPRIRDGVYTLLERLKLDRLVVPCSFGNHGRTTDRKRVATGYANSFEFLLYSTMAQEFRNDPRVTFEVTASSHQYVKVYDRTLHFTHGDSVKYQGGVGGIGIPLLKAVPQWDLVRRAEYHHVGHFHSYVDFGRLLVNGSLIGYGPYSQEIRASFEPPQQAFYLLDKVRGKCQATPIWVDDHDQSREAV